MKVETIAGQAMRRWVKFQTPGEQKLLYYRPGAEARPLIELSPERDVQEYWLTQARAAVDGHEVDTATVRTALRFYANVSGGCRTALQELEATP
jgi:hypothetical protein